VREYLRIPPVTDIDRMVMNIPPNVDPHARPKPKKPPQDDVEISFSQGRRWDNRIDKDARTLKVWYRIAGKRHRNRGTYSGVEIRYWVRDLWADGQRVKAPASPDEEGWKSALNRSSPWLCPYEEGDWQKELHVTMRWKNSLSPKHGPENNGPWCQIKSTIIQ
jgi:hypothetical protein